MLTKKKLNASTKFSISPSESVGYCLICGAQVSKCGKPFTAELRCQKCGAVNVYEESQQPKFLKYVA